MVPVSVVDEFCDDFPNVPRLAITQQFPACADWWVGTGKTPKNPKLALRNWLTKTAGQAQYQLSPSPTPAETAADERDGEVLRNLL